MSRIQLTSNVPVSWSGHMIQWIFQHKPFPSGRLAPSPARRSASPGPVLFCEEFAFHLCTCLVFLQGHTVRRSKGCGCEVCTVLDEWMVNALLVMRVEKTSPLPPHGIQRTHCQHPTARRHKTPRGPCSSPCSDIQTCLIRMTQRPEMTVLHFDFFPDSQFFALFFFSLILFIVLIICHWCGSQVRQAIERSHYVRLCLQQSLSPGSSRALGPLVCSCHLFLTLRRQTI